MPFTRRDGRQFGLTLAMAFLVLTGLMAWRRHEIAAYGAAALCVLLLASAVALPGHLGPIHRAWMAFAEALSKVTTPIFMSALYWLIFTPVGFVRRRAGRNPLERQKNQDSYWVSRGAPRRSDLRRQF